MAEKFGGNLSELKALVLSAGLSGEWTEGGGKNSFRTAAGGVLNWWPSTGTIQFQGVSAATAPLKLAIETGYVDGSPSKSPVVSRQIFIVHGHDVEARDQIELALHRLDLEPYVLMNNSSGGKTLIEALEGKIGKDYSADFGIVLMTPDDFGRSKKEPPEKDEPRARQNVVLEAGMLLASLTRSRIAIVVKGHLELPSDLEGIIRLGYNDHIKEVIPKLCQRLKEAGFDLSPSHIASASQ